MTSKKIAKLEKDLAEAKRALSHICQIVSRENSLGHAEKVGGVRAVASWGLELLGDTTYRDKFAEEGRKSLEEMNEKYPVDGQPFLKVA